MRGGSSGWQKLKGQSRFPHVCNGEMVRSHTWHHERRTKGYVGHIKASTCVYVIVPYVHYRRCVCHSGNGGRN